MAASVLNLTTAIKDDPTGVQGLIAFSRSATIPTTSLDDAGDDVLLHYFPAGTFLRGDSLHVDTSIMDTHATVALVVDFGIGDSDGVIDTVIINDSAAAQTGINDISDGGVDLAKWLDVGEKYLIMTVVTAAATAAAGTVVASGTLAFGLIEQ